MDLLQEIMERFSIGEGIARDLRRDLPVLPYPSPYYYNFLPYNHGELNEDNA